MTPSLEMPLNLLRLLALSLPAQMGLGRRFWVILLDQLHDQLLMASFPGLALSTPSMPMHVALQNPSN